MLRLPEPGTFKTLVSTVAVPTAGLWRLSKRPASEPYWARDAQSRFDDPAGAIPGAATFGVLYAGQDPETAFCESVIHENSLFLNGAFVVSKAGLVARSLVGFKHPTKPSLTLADLTGAGLKTPGLNNDISAGNDYCVSQAWAAATGAWCARSWQGAVTGQRIGRALQQSRARRLVRPHAYGYGRLGLGTW
jgi:hypothetical protein